MRREQEGDMGEREQGKAGKWGGWNSREAGKHGGGGNRGSGGGGGDRGEGRNREEAEGTKRRGQRGWGLGKAGHGEEETARVGDREEAGGREIRDRARRGL